MAVNRTVAVEVTTFQYALQDERGTWDGLWSSIDTVVGDASGGAVTHSINAPVHLLRGALVTLEDMDLSVIDAADPGSVEFRRQVFTGKANPLLIESNADLLTTTASNWVVGAERGSATQRGWVVPTSPQPDVILASNQIFGGTRAPNVNGATYTFNAWGLWRYARPNLQATGVVAAPRT